MTLLIDIDTKKESKDNLDELFLQSKDIALQPLQMLFEAEVKHERSKKTRHLSEKVNKSVEKEKKTSRTKKRKKTQKSQKSTSNTNKKSHRRKSGHDSQIYNSNIVIVHDEEEESCGDPIEKEVEKLKKLMAKNRRKKKKGTSKSSKSYSASSK